jgi:hypothetical protein
VSTDGPLDQLRGTRDCKYCLGALVALGLAVALGGHALAVGDVATALAAVLFLPAAALLAGIGLRGGRTGRSRPRSDG